MLRITLVESRDGGAIIRLEGKLLAPWVGEVQAVCCEHPTAQLDLSAVTYVDASGRELLAALAAAGITLTGCSPFVATLLNREAQP